MLKSRPHVLLSLLALAGITVFSSVQYGLWNVRAGNVNAGPLAYFNSGEKNKDVTSDPQYAALVNAIRKQYPDSQIQILDRVFQWGALRGFSRMLSVAVVVPSLDDKLQRSVVGPKDKKEFFKSGQDSWSKRIFSVRMSDIFDELRFGDFDVQNICVISNFVTQALPENDFRIEKWKQDKVTSYLVGMDVKYKDETNRKTFNNLSFIQTQDPYRPAKILETEKDYCFSYKIRSQGDRSLVRSSVIL